MIRASQIHTDNHILKDLLTFGALGAATGYLTTGTAQGGVAGALIGSLLPVCEFSKSTNTAILSIALTAITCATNPSFKEYYLVAGLSSVTLESTVPLFLLTGASLASQHLANYQFLNWISTTVPVALTLLSAGLMRVSVVNSFEDNLSLRTSLQSFSWVILTGICAAKPNSLYDASYEHIFILSTVSLLIATFFPLAVRTIGLSTEVESLKESDDAKARRIDYLGDLLDNERKKIWDIERTAEEQRNRMLTLKGDLETVRNQLLSKGDEIALLQGRLKSDEELIEQLLAEQKASRTRQSASSPTGPEHTTSSPQLVPTDEAVNLKDLILLEYLCVIGQVPIEGEPVLDPTNLKSIYERKAIETWLASKSTSPTTRQPLTKGNLISLGKLKEEFVTALDKISAQYHLVPRPFVQSESKAPSPSSQTATPTTTLAEQAATGFDQGTCIFDAEIRKLIEDYLKLPFFLRKSEMIGEISQRQWQLRLSPPEYYTLCLSHLDLSNMELKANVSEGVIDNVNLTKSKVLGWSISGSIINSKIIGTTFKSCNFDKIDSLEGTTIKDCRMDPDCTTSIRGITGRDIWPYFQTLGATVESCD